MIKVREKLNKKNRLIAIVCRDETDFCIDYYFDNMGKISILKFNVPRNEPKIESITPDYPGADYYEREIHDFFGVEFEGNMNLHLKLFLPENWNEKPPLLKGDNNA